MDLITRVDQSPHTLLTIELPAEITHFHAHKKGQLSYFDGGSSHLHTDHSIFFIPTGHFAWIPPHHIHQFNYIETLDIRVNNLYIPTEYIRTHPFFSQIGVYRIHPLLKEVLRFANNGEYVIGNDTFALLQSVVVLLPSLTTDQLTLRLPTSNHHILKRILNYLMQNLNSDLSLNLIANRFNLGAKTFSRLFEKEMAITYFQYVKTARIMRSIELILEREHNLTEIAFKVGYGSLAAFSNAFYALMGKRPTEFKIE